LGAKDVSFTLLRVGSLLHARNVEAKLRRLESAVAIKYDPNQPRVPAGSPDGGQWTEAEGGERPGGTVGPGQSSTSGTAEVQKIVDFARRKALPAAL
jgi:hypothetical protein